MNSRSPSHGHGHGQRAGPGALAVASALAPGEARRILRSVALLLFLPISVLTLVAASEDSASWPIASMRAALGLVPLAWCLLVITNLATLRDKRHGVAVITDVLPASQTARSIGYLLGGCVGVPVGAGLLLVWFLIHPGSPIGAPDLAELAVPLLLVAGGAVLGVASARWLPSALFTVPVILATIFITGQVQRSAVHRARFLGFVADPPATLVPELEVRPSTWHLVWLLAWVGIMATVAILRFDRSRPVIVTALALVAVATAAGIAQTRPIGAETATARAGLLNSPGPHQRCREVAGVSYCSYPSTDDQMDTWTRTVRSVMANVPVQAHRRDLVVSQRVPWISGNRNCGPSRSLDLVDTPIAERVDVEQAWPADGHVHPGIAGESLPCSAVSLGTLFTAVQVGAWAVGLPPAQWGEGQTCTADGQARSAVALWLGASAGGRLDRYIENVGGTAGGRADVSDWDNPPTWGVDWHPSDLDAARAMNDLAEDEVAEAVARHWNELVDPSTSTDRLYELLDLGTQTPTDSARQPTCRPT